MSSQTTRSVYLDHAATTPMRPEAIAAMTEELGQLGNPSSLHTAGRRARRVVEESREQLAEVFGARPSEVVFTSGGTEADNLAVKGLYWARQDVPAPRGCWPPRSSTTRCSTRSRWLEEHQGAEAVWLGVDPDGTVRPEALRAAISQARRPGGPGQRDVGEQRGRHGRSRSASWPRWRHEYGIPFHTDAVQAAAQLPVDFAASGADALTVTGHKLGGPVGVGALILARGVEPVPVLHGGGQERDIRSGTLDTPAIRAFAVAAEPCARSSGPSEAERLAALRDDLVRQVLAAVPDAVLNGPPLGTGPAARQRALLLPRLRGRRAAHAARRERHRLLHRLGLHRGRGRAQPRPAGHGRRRAPGPAARCASPSATPPPSTTSTRWSPSSARSSTAPAAPPPRRQPGEAT